MNGQHGPYARLFFALWPDPLLAQALADHALAMGKHAGGKAVPAQKIHMTLFFLGEVSDAQRERMGSVPDLQCGPLQLDIDWTGCWPKNGIAWAAPSHSPPALERLVRRLGDWLRSESMQMESRPFTPHITLLRRASCGVFPALGQTLHWAVRDFVLVRSRLGPPASQYEIIERYPLNALEGKVASSCTEPVG
jgi:2'-5' RNA ligase